MKLQTRRRIPLGGSLVLPRGPRMFFVLTVRCRRGHDPISGKSDLDIGMHLAIIPQDVSLVKRRRQRPDDAVEHFTFQREQSGSFGREICAPKLKDPVDGMGLIVTDRSYTSASATETRRRIASEARLNLLAVEYGYKYRVDVCAGNTLLWVEFVRTLQEARFVGRPLRRSGSTVRLFKITSDGDLRPQRWG